MLVEQAEANISRALIDADKPEAVESGEFPMNNIMKMGRITTFPHALTIHAVRALAMMKMKLDLNTNIWIAQPTRRPYFLPFWSVRTPWLIVSNLRWTTLSCKTTTKTRASTVEDCRKRLKRNSRR
ncbi:hypothetical protein LNO81_30350 [Klebsiella variicola subsp. variicola]|nr:hypothetical protein [Klebsiella variicola subsp. variicola]